ncbi:MAG: hypothetical protein IKY45_02800 [Clostridia bacterium]|nr:hypothetical protein [Clostridia bacterium]
MKEILKTGLKIYGKTVVASIMSFFIVISMSTITTAFFSENIGYKAYGTTSESSEYTELYTYYFEDGEDTQKTEFEQQGYTLKLSDIRSGFSKSGNLFYLISSQIFCLSIVATLIYGTTWTLGIKDNNMVRIGQKTEDILKGFKAGLISIIPCCILIVCLMILKNSAAAKFPSALLKLVTTPFYSFSELIIGSAATLKDLSVIRFVGLCFLQFLIPVISGVAYYLGYRDISLGERFIYKKKVK